jgi:CheY-like chemotaxis protein
MRTHPLLTLIADDSDDDRFLFSRAVRLQAGFQVAGITVDGLETVMYLRGTTPYGNRARYPFPDIVLLDYEMPGYNGLEVLASLLKTARRPRVILWSSAIERIDKHLAYELGAAMVCSKPLLTGQIQNTLKAVASKTPDPFVVSPWNAPRDRGTANRLAVAPPTL